MTFSATHCNKHILSSVFISLHQLTVSSCIYSLYNDLVTVHTIHHCVCYWSPKYYIKMLEIIFTVFVCLTFFVYLAEFCLRFNRHYKAFLKLDSPGPYLPVLGNALEVILFNSCKIKISILDFVYVIYFIFCQTASSFRILSEHTRRYKNGYAYYSLGKLYYHIHTAADLEVFIYTILIL